MPTWNEIDAEIEQNALEEPSNVARCCDEARKKYLAKLEEYTGRTTVAYYSAFLQVATAEGRSQKECSINDLDMNGFMAVFHNISRDKGLDLIIHTPGGGTEATRAIVEYIYKMFGPDLRVIVPHLAMSAGTMIACAAKAIVMGKHSSLGPTDPHIRGYAALGVLSEIETA